MDNKDSVEKLLGRPSFTGQFTPNDWYYVSRDISQVAFRNPRVIRQTVMIVRFDPTIDRGELDARLRAIPGLAARSYRYEATNVQLSHGTDSTARTVCEPTTNAK